VEGQGLRDSAQQFADLGAVILGASFDTPADNLAFAAAQEYPFRLLSDIDQTVGRAYEVSRPADHRYARFPRRYSYLIDTDGIIRRAYDVTDVEHHAEHVLHDLRELLADAAE